MALEQSRLGHFVSVLAAALDQRSIDSVGESLDWVSLDTTSRARFAWRAARWIVLRRPDVVHLHSRPEIGRLAKALGYPGVVALSFDYPYMYPAAVHRLLPRALVAYELDRSVDLFLPVTDFATSALGKLGVVLESHRTRVLWNGVHGGQTRLARAPDAPRALFVGRFVRQKGADLFVAAAAGLLSWDFVAVGPIGSFGSECREGYALGRVKHLGVLSDKQVEEQMRASTCLVLPTREWEVFGMVLIESLALGVPVVAPNAAGPREILRGAPGCRFFEPGNVTSLREAIESCLGVSAAERRAAQKFVQRFAWTALAEASLVYYGV